MDDFIIRALLGGIGLAVVAGVLGCFIVWRRMAYFSDSLAHSTLTGVALGWAVALPLGVATLSVCLVFAALLIWMQNQQTLRADTLLGILAHSTLAIGMVLLSLGDWPALDWHGLLFGDILSVSLTDLGWIYGGGAVVLVVLKIYWQRLLLITINKHYAVAEGENAFLLHCIMVALIAITVSFSIRVIGVLLISALLIIPAATASLFARSPEAMAKMAAVIGGVSVVAGIGISFMVDIVTAPLIVAIASLCFFSSFIIVHFSRLVK